MTAGRRGLLIGAALGLALSAPAFAQTAPAAAAPAVKPDQIDAIVVTAQRREQRLQDVGIAVTALGGKSIASLGLKDSTDLVRAVPSLKLNAYTPSAVVFNIRGISQNDFGDEQEPPVAVYQDDSYASSFVSSGFPMFDLQRVEVLRGPQGTLFGRNATGGAIQFISNKPTKDYQGYVSATYGSYDDLNVEGAVSGPLADNVQMRLSGMHEAGDGYLKSIYPGVSSRGGQNHWALRDIIEWQPTANSNVELEVRYGQNPHENSAGMYSWEAAYPGLHGQGAYLPANVDYWGTGAGADASGYRNDAIDAVRGGDPWKVAALGRSYTDRSLFDTKLKIEAPLGPVRITSITDYQANYKYYLEDASASPNDVVIFQQGAHIKQYSQELRGAAEFGDHQVVVGAFGMVIDGRYTASYGFPSLDFIPDVRFSERTTSYAFFAQDEWKLPGDFKAILGARYWHDQRKVNYLATDNTGEKIIFNSSEVVAIKAGTNVSDLTGVTVTPADANKEFSDYSLRAELDYKPSNSLLVYASFNRGTKSGGFTLSTSTPTAGFEADFLNGIPYKPEVLNAYEIGVKTNLPYATTFNVTGFYYDYHNYQAFAQYGLVQNVVNLPAEELGLEVELTTHPIHGLTLQANTSLLDNKVKNVPLPDHTIVDHRFPQAPKVSADVLARYEFPVGPGDVSIQADAEYTGRYCFSVLCAPVEREAPHIVGNVRFGFTPNNKKWDVAVFVNNVGQEIYRVYTFDVAGYTGQIPSVYAKPRTWGVSATYHFGG
ncbi:MAG: TonB-dependent receptor [Caulobacteraceae bacterium]|nr:TonB-dependent receptor [Caulobacteraceae bacterium]